MTTSNTERLKLFFSKPSKHIIGTDLGQPNFLGIPIITSRAISDDTIIIASQEKLNNAWNLSAEKIKKHVISATIVQCDVCGGGMLSGENCPYCGRKSIF